MASEEFNQIGLSANSLMSDTPGYLAGRYWIDNTGDGTGMSAIYTGTTVKLRSFSNGAHGCASDGSIGAACEGNGFSFSGGTADGYYEFRVMADDTTYNAWWLLFENYDCTGGGADLRNGFEADIVEVFSPGTTQQNVHWGGFGSCHASSPSAGPTSSDGFHNWGVMWPDPAHNGGISFWRDGVQLSYVNGPVMTGVNVSGNMCCGGIQILSWNPDYDGKITEVDWVRYYRPR